MLDIFKKPIDRDINGVIKVGQQGEEDKRVELEEYVLTRELNGYFDRFYSHYVESLQRPNDRIGVWISGFFGSGKSHFLKILSYLLKNERVAGEGALRLFEMKVQDPKLLADMQRAGETPKDVILFNIDSKAEASSKHDKEAVVKVFMRVFDEHLGYFGAAPELADFERRLAKQGKYEQFKEAYEREVGESWLVDRENWGFREDEVATVLQKALGMSEEAARNLYNRLDNSYTLSVEGFAHIVRDYLKSRDPKHQVVFMVDEVGQYIGENSDLMLNLQTIAEDLGTHCAGRAWIVVTSQEDIDSITQNRVKGNDFSKIQGRFKNRISLSSANTDEVIKLRLLEKTPEAQTALRALFESSSQALQNLIRFSDGTAEMPGFHRDRPEDFVRVYPFVPYQFKLLQSVFTQIRLHGATGKHLAAGERSMLDAFQISALKLRNDALGALAPFSSFYAAVEGFLDGAIKLIITQAADNGRLEAFDVDILKTLFMIKYVKELNGSVENLTTLEIRHIDEDRHALKGRLEQSLRRLETETLIQRNGDAYEFLTNEEQDIGREIKGFTFNPGEDTTELHKLLWEELFTTKKYRFDARHDYSFNRKLDESYYGSSSDDLTLHIATPQGDEYRDLQEDHNSLMRSGAGNSVIVRLPDDKALFEELTQYVKTDRYVKQKNKPGLSTSIRTIIQTRADENLERRKRIRDALEARISDASVFVRGIKLERTGSNAKDVLSNGLKALVEGTYTKLTYVKSPFNSDDDIETVLRGGLNAMQTLEGEHPNALAHNEMGHYLNEQGSRQQTVTLRSLETQFGSRPYGWAKRDIHGILAELLVQNAAELRHNQHAVNPQEAGLVRKMSSREGLDSYTVRVPPVVDPQDFRVGRELASEYLGLATVSNEPQALYDAYRDRLGKRQADVHDYLQRAKGGNYPFKGQLEAHEKLLKGLLSASTAADFFAELKKLEGDFEDFAEDSLTIEGFYRGQIDLFDRSRARLTALSNDLSYLGDSSLRTDVETAQTILALPNPTSRIPELDTLLRPVENHVQRERETRQEDARRALTQACATLTSFGEENGLEPSTLPPLLQPLTALQHKIDNALNIDAVVAARSLIDATREAINKTLVERINALANAPDRTPDVPPMKPITTLKSARFAPKNILETPDDVNRYLETLRTALMNEVQAGKRVKLE